MKKEFKLGAFWFLPFFVIVYLGIAIPGRAFYEKREVFPFFAWSLYSKTPSVMKRVTLGVKMGPADEMVNLYDHLYLSGISGVALRSKLGIWQAAFERGDEGRMKRLQLEIEQTILDESVYSYQFLLETFKPSERLLHKKILGLRVLSKEFVL